MLLTLVVILILIGSAVVGSLYSNFLVFYSNFSETENYNKAYYASISALERAQLVLRQHKPGYEGSGGWIKSEAAGSYFGSDIPTTEFSYLSDNHKESSMFWEINSRTNQIPAPGKGDVDLMMSTGDSENFNKMDYENSEIILLYYDNSTANPYNSGINITKSHIQGISTEIRLPGLMSGDFGPLDTETELDVSSDNKDDAIVDWQIKGYFNSGGILNPFTIFSTQLRGHINDSVIRESTINGRKIIEFGGSSWDPTDTEDLCNSTCEANIISPSDSQIKSALDKYQTIFQSTSDYTGLELKFSLLNLLRGIYGSGTIYPFLEYNVTFSSSTSSDVVVPDKYYKIKAEGGLGDYLIDTIIYKPTTTESILRSFTTIL